MHITELGPHYTWSKNPKVVVVDVTTLKMAMKPVKKLREVQQDALVKVNTIKEVSRRE